MVDGAQQLSSFGRCHNGAHSCAIDSSVISDFHHCFSLSFFRFCPFMVCSCSSLTKIFFFFSVSSFVVRLLDGARQQCAVSVLSKYLIFEASAQKRKCVFLSKDQTENFFCSFLSLCLYMGRLNLFFVVHPTSEKRNRKREEKSSVR
jgi:hypothetical protein